MDGPFNVFGQSDWEISPDLEVTCISCTDDPTICDNCEDYGCGEVLSIVGLEEIEGYYSVRRLMPDGGLLDSSINGREYYERVEPSRMYLYSYGGDRNHWKHGNWHFSTELGSQVAIFRV